MKKEGFNEFKKELEKTREDLVSQLDDLEKPVEMGSDVDHFDEETDEAKEFSNRLGIIQTLKKHLRTVEAAILKIIRGGYGRCEKCRKQIEEEILKIDPESKYCRLCKSSEPRG